mmetsp:Transcript_42571/g.134392  ORF Transcript_42571/g.134392 Transcript_42571/m.134392 type:complete len:357 (-) Transcript_42571:230-1300(-)
MLKFDRRGRGAWASFSRAGPRCVGGPKVGRRRGGGSGGGGELLQLREKQKRLLEQPLLRRVKHAVLVQLRLQEILDARGEEVVGGVVLDRVQVRRQEPPSLLAGDLIGRVEAVPRNVSADHLGDDLLGRLVGVAHRDDLQLALIRLLYALPRRVERVHAPLVAVARPLRVAGRHSALLLERERLAAARDVNQLEPLAHALAPRLAANVAELLDGAGHLCAGDNVGEELLRHLLETGLAPELVPNVLREERGDGPVGAAAEARALQHRIDLGVDAEGDCAVVVGAALVPCEVRVNHALHEVIHEHVPLLPRQALDGALQECAEPLLRDAVEDALGDEVDHGGARPIHPRHALRPQHL